MSVGHYTPRHQPHGGHPDQSILNRWFAHCIPLLHQVDEHLGGHRVGAAARVASDHLSAPVPASPLKTDPAGLLNALVLWVKG